MFNNSSKYNYLVTFWAKQLANFPREEWAERYKWYSHQVKGDLLDPLPYKEKALTRLNEIICSVGTFSWQEFDWSLLFCWYSVTILQIGHCNTKKYFKKQCVRKYHSRAFKMASVYLTEYEQRCEVSVVI